MKQNTGYFIAAVLTTVPLVFWFTGETFAYKFIDLQSTFTSIGQVLGLSGIALYAISLMLSARLRIFESLFGGMNRVYRAHHLLGGIAFLLLMVHPLMLAGAKLQESTTSAALFLLPGEDWTINLGIIALLTLMTLLILTYYADIPYHIWHWTHRCMGLAFIIGVLHMIYVESDVVRDQRLQVYLLVLSGIGILLYTYRTLLGKWVVPKSYWIISSIRPLRNNITEVILQPQKKFVSFLPGQFVFVSFKTPGISSETHPFSLSADPNTSGLRLTMKTLGDYTSTLSRLFPGVVATVEGPYGKFCENISSPTPQLWIAGGIGITPFVSMARSLPAAAPPIDLFYSIRDDSEAVYLDELTAMIQRCPNFRVFPIVTSKQGRLTVEQIRQISGDITNREIYICGPPSMMHTLKNQLRKAGIPLKRIHTEEFELLN